MVPQHFMLVPVLTVAENVPRPGTVPGQGPRHGRREADPGARDQLGSSDPRTLIDPLSRPAAAGRDPKSLYRGANLLVLDEPTAVLTPQDTLEIFGLLPPQAEGTRSSSSPKARRCAPIAEPITSSGGRVVDPRRLRPPRRSRQLISARCPLRRRPGRVEARWTVPSGQALLVKAIEPEG